MSSDSDDEILAGGGSGIGTRRQLRRRAGAAGAGTGAGRRLRDEDSEEDSGSEIEQARPKKGKKIPLPAEEDEAGPSGVQQNAASDNDSSAWESDWNSDEEKLLKQGGQEAAAALVSKLGYASDSSTSSGDGDKCPICLLSLNDQEVGVPEVCDHMFCAPCIEEWAKNVTTCPIDRKNFDAINVYKSVDRKQLVRKNQVQTKPADEVPVLEDHELTYCEVCRRPDREDTMLLCDACNLGFHMECLSPPLEIVPVGSWYCDCCFASASEEDDEEVNDLLNDLDNEMGGLRQTRLRQRMYSPPRIVRTRQSERIRSTILTRTSTAVRLNVVQDDQQPGPSSRRTARAPTTAAAAAAPSRSVRKRRKRRTRRKILHMIISEYDVNNDDEKFAVRRKKIYKTLKRLSKKRSKRKRTSRGSRSTRKSAAGVSSGMEGAVADLQQQRFSTGIPTLKLFGGANDLDYFSDEEGGDDLEADVSIGGRGETALQSARAAIRNPLGRRRALKSGFEPSSSSGPVDLLGSIMQDQARWHSKQGTKDIKIDNGKIIFQAEVPSKKTNQVPGTSQAGLGQNSSGNAALPETSSAGTADSTSSNAAGGSGSTAGPSSSSAGASVASSSSGGAGESGGNGRGNDLFDPLDTSIFVDLPPLKGKENEKEAQKKKDETEDPMDTSIFVDLPPIGAPDKDKKKKNDEFDMFGKESPIPLPQRPPTSQVPLNPAPEISTTTTPDGAEPGPSRGFGKFKFTMTSEPDNDNCPNMSMYSSETLEYTKNTGGGEDPYDPLDSEQKTDDEGGERDEDLVQLDDEDPVEQSSPAKPHDQQEGIPNGTDKLPTGDPDHDAFDSDSEDELKQIEEVEGPEPEPSTELEALTPPLTTTVAASMVTSSTAVTTVASVASSVDEGNGPIASSAQGGEEDRSYTPCLDEKYQEARREHDRSGNTPDLPPAGSPKEGIDGMDTELISEEDEDTFKEDETAAASTSKATSSGAARRKDATFKKVNKRGKERNYRGDKDKDNSGKKKDRSDNKENDSRRSRDRDRDRDRNRSSRRPRRKELPRYDVRTVIAEKRPKVVKDPFGRDVTPKPVSKTRSRSPAERRREMSISLSPEPPRRFNRRRSVSPRFNRARNRTPPTFFRRSRSPEAPPGGRPVRMRSVSRSRSPIVHRHRPSRSVSRSASPPGRHGGRVPVMAPESPQLGRGKAKKPKKKKGRQAASPSRSRSPSEGRGGKKKGKKSRKKKNKHRGGSPSGAAGSAQKKKKSRRRSTSPMLSPSRSRSGSPIPGQTTGVLTERFAKVRQQNSWTPPPPTRPKTNGTNLTVILTNEEALAKQAKERERKRKEARRRDRARDKNLPSKEVFTSGDNILVSVSFNDKNLNKENQQAAGGEGGEVSSAAAQKRMKDIAKKRAEAEKAKRKRLERLKKTRGEAPKPVVIIDLDRSPFRVITPSPRAVIVLSDSDVEKEKERREGTSGVANGGQSTAEANATGGASTSQRKSPAERHDEDMFGPKTPPGFPSQPQPSQGKPAAPKFTMQVKSKSTNLRPLNPLYEPGELDEGKTPERMDNAESSNYNMVGPNTPPEPAPQSPSPDVYDPFEPTKSPSPSPSRRDNASIERLSDLDDAVLPSSSGKVDGPDSGAGGDPKADSQNADESMNGDQEPPPTRGSKITILSNIVISQPSNSGQGVVSGSGVSSANQQLNSTGDDSDVIFDDFVSSSAPAPSNNVGYSTSSSANPIKSYSTAANSSSLISKLPLPPGAAGGQKFSDFINPTDSPYSPGASDFDDLFEPGGELDSPPPAPTKQSYKPTKIPTKGAKKGGGGGGNFDNLFGGSPANNFGKRKKGGHKRRGKPKGGDDEEDVSKLSTKERFMRKLNRLERVVEEVKLVIKPFYNKKQINKEEYKDILRRAVPKICHSRTGEINPIKIQKLIKAYVHKVRARRRLAKKGGAGGGGGGGGGPVGLPGVNINPMII
ncbi:PHD and RING finger domain-containing protein 1-like isoform X1 [Culex quinquefasciatus]|uniref:PHD and RING finger domain-containing protein 1-like isoform X1 n=1 Tax=Culex quinquefasciatus TaxID=7176 RepID=UPI0018E2CB6D|nr:PHD and RING finger domain-containing protein 1-like isoform X1 [Culex quinquefasciatus]